MDHGSLNFESSLTREYGTSRRDKYHILLIKYVRGKGNNANMIIMPLTRLSAPGLGATEGGGARFQWKHLSSVLSS